ncbi:MAG: endonuclease III [Gemmatimonadetes bacterium]|nr:endonuclease III [Gemmatimonadota bacterium]MYE70820.1 endonuclease III [Gemmatimonadota bacterium]MYJ67197.1 endonuclease III [Gemmatimonadota bacterium]
MSPRESKKARTERAATIYEILLAEYPDAECALEYASPYELAVATILSAQCTDARVNMVTPGLFRRYPDPESLAAAVPAELEDVIRSTGFFRNKTRNLVGMATALLEEHGGELPRNMKELSALPGIGRKTANVILGNAFGIDEGVVVDTHVKRLSGRMRFTTQSTPEKIERDLIAIFPRSVWTMLAHLLIYHGRQVCHARKPKCHQCAVSHLCPSSAV